MRPKRMRQTRLPLESAAPKDHTTPTHKRPWECFHDATLIN